MCHDAALTATIACHQQDVLEMYHECVGEDDVVDKYELMNLITAKGLRFAVYNRSVQRGSTASDAPASVTT